jgi:hypothetical protein
MLFVNEGLAFRVRFRGELVFFAKRQFLYLLMKY